MFLFSFLSDYLNWHSTKRVLWLNTVTDSVMSGHSFFSSFWSHNNNTQIIYTHAMADIISLCIFRSVNRFPSAIFDLIYRFRTC